MENSPLLECRYRCTQEELFQLFRRGELRRAGKTRIGVQCAVLGLVTVYCLIAFFGGGMTEFGSLWIALAAVIIGAVMLVVPDWRFRHEAQLVAEQGRETRIRLYEEGLAFGNDDEILPVRQCRPLLFDDMAVLRFSGGALLCVPKRALSPEEWQLLRERLSAETGKS